MIMSIIEKAHLDLVMVIIYKNDKQSVVVFLFVWWILHGKLSPHGIIILWKTQIQVQP